ncbi:MAG TPA: amidohydrolase family protein, partial [Chitinophagaceae bacterium]|nr:amidohydrolase family protein [Chitinophagaceae bacterium]
MKKCITIILPFTFFCAGAQTNGSEQKMDFEKYNPPSTLVVPEHKLTRAKFPFIDVHNHQFRMPDMDLGVLIRSMDQLNMKVMVNLSGQSGDRLKSSVINVKDHYPKRFIVFANVDFKGVGTDGWAESAAKQLEEDVKNGAKGLKIYKSLGFSVTDNQGKRVAVDDARLDPIWKKAGELRIPVLIHTADPKPFWDPMDENNERWLELATHPNRKKEDSNPALWETLIG